MPSAKEMTLEVNGLNQVLATLTMLDERMKNRISRIAISKGAGIISKAMKTKAVENGYPDLGKAIGVDVGKTGKSFYAKIGAIARFKIVRKQSGGRIFDARQRIDKYLTSRGGTWSRVLHLMEFGTKPHLIVVPIGNKVLYIDHPGAKPIPLVRPVWAENQHAAQAGIESKMWEEVLKSLAHVK